MILAALTPPFFAAGAAVDARCADGVAPATTLLCAAHAVTQRRRRARRVNIIDALLHSTRPFINDVSYARCCYAAAYATLLILPALYARAPRCLVPR